MMFTNVLPLSSLQRKTYPVAPRSGAQPNRTELWVISATCKVVVPSVAPAVWIK